MKKGIHSWLKMYCALEGANSSQLVGDVEQPVQLTPQTFWEVTKTMNASARGRMYMLCMVESIVEGLSLLQGLEGTSDFESAGVPPVEVSIADHLALARVFFCIGVVSRALKKRLYRYQAARLMSP